jgi:hypothetical protein
MNRIVLVGLFLILGIATSVAQRYPIPIVPGQSQQVGSPGDTLWVLSNSQFDRALICKSELSICDSIGRLQKDKTLSLTKKIAEQDSIIAVLEEGYERYTNKWETCDKALEQEKISVVKQKKLKWIFGGIGLAVGAGATGALVYLLAR